MLLILNAGNGDRNGLIDGSRLYDDWPLLLLLLKDGSSSSSNDGARQRRLLSNDGRALLLLLLLLEMGRGREYGPERGARFADGNDLLR